MATLTFDAACKCYPGETDNALSDFDLEVADGEFVALVGPSGCGKSTALRMVAGLENISAGEIRIGERVVNAVPPQDRDVAMVFQSYALYPHKTVYANLAFGLKLRKTPKAEIARRVDLVASSLGLEALLKRKPGQLSGGQRQRVALGRAIVREPQVFLMDEPLSNLDAQLRVQTRLEILKLHRELGTTFVYVTHDQVEAMTMGDRIVVLRDGLLQQVDTPRALYENPANMFVAGFIGSPAMNFLRVTFVSTTGDTAHLRAGDLSLHLPVGALPEAAAIGGELVVGIRPEHLLDARLADPDLPRLAARVELVEMLGSELHAHLAVGEHSLTARLDPRSGTVDAGGTMEVALDVERLRYFGAADGLALR